MSTQLLHTSLLSTKFTKLLSLLSTITYCLTHTTMKICILSISLTSLMRYTTEMHKFTTRSSHSVNTTIHIQVDMDLVTMLTSAIMMRKPICLDSSRWEANKWVMDLEVVNNRWEVSRWEEVNSQVL